MSTPKPDNDKLKILQDLQKKQQKLKKQGQGKSSDTESEPPIPRTIGHGPNGTVIPLVATPQRERIALQHALSNSDAFFITQNSSFGNMVLPVLPRF